jgi:hypothetical protein
MTMMALEIVRGTNNLLEDFYQELFLSQEFTGKNTYKSDLQ